MINDERARAIERIREKRRLSMHLSVFLVMSIYFVFLWSRTSSAVFWPIWPMLGWGFGLAVHATRVLGWQRPISEERIERELSRTR